MKSATFLLTALLLAGCSKNIDTTEAVREGVIKDISKKVDVGSMDINVDSVSFRQNEADAQVSFMPKGGGKSQAITMTYLLERQGDEWHIKNRNMSSHMQQQQPGQTALPPGHPSVSGAPKSGTPLPAGHPQVPNSSK
ncbi:MAG TPA: hypothetical protein VK789_25820 [Bryobacteraceae bacterium]|nr:hypothetical protein [Bryobacteraceae bacterium]